jgi:hypothetical protein
LGEFHFGRHKENGESQSRGVDAIAGSGRRAFSKEVEKIQAWLVDSRWLPS